MSSYKIKTNDKHNNGGTLYFDNGLLYKYYDDCPLFLEEKERNIDFLIKNHIYNTPKIYKKIYKENDFNGYIMEYIESAKTLREGMNDDISINSKIKIIKDLYISLREIHNLGICLGDIHMDNFLYKNDNGYTIDLDEIRFPGDEFKFRECYLIKETKTSQFSKIATPITDNIKLAICSLSFLYKIDLEIIIINDSLEEVKEKLKNIVSNTEYEEYSKVLDINSLYYLDEVFKQKTKIL